MNSGEEILPLLLRGFKLSTFCSQVQRSTSKPSRLSSDRYLQLFCGFWSCGTVKAILLSTYEQSCICHRPVSCQSLKNINEPLANHKRLCILLEKLFLWLAVVSFMIIMIIVTPPPAPPSSQAQDHPGSISTVSYSGSN